MNRREVIRLIGAIAASSGATTLSLADEVGKPIKGGNLRYATVTSVSSLDPHIASGTSWQILVSILYDRLVDYDADGRIVPMLAERWEVPDPKTYIFHLRPDVVFHGGQKLSAKDVVFSIERILNPVTGSSLGATIAGAKVSLVDDQTIRFDLMEPNASLLASLTMPDAAIVSKDWMEQKPNIRVEANGTGPFILATYEAGVRALLKKSPRYHDEALPYLDSLSFQMIPNDAARVNMLRSGGAEMIDFVPWQDIESLRREPGVKVSALAGSFMNIWFNTSRPPFNDPRVRRAVAYAVDRQAISKAAFFGYGKPLYGPPTASGSSYYHPELENYFSYDPDKARNLLKEAGIEGRLKIDLIVLQSLSIYTTTAQILQASLKQAGIDVNIKLTEWAQVVEMKDRGDYDALILGVGIKSPDPNVYAFYFGAGTSYWARGANFNDQNLEELLRAGRATMEQEARSKIYRKVEERILELSPWVFLTWREDAWALRAKVRNYRPLGGALLTASVGMSLPRMWIER